MLVQVPHASEAVVQDEEPENQHKVPITIVTGYLGAGSKWGSLIRRSKVRGALGAQQFSSPAPGNPGSPGLNYCLARTALPLATG